MSNAPKRAWGPDTKVHGLVRHILHGSLFRNGHLDVKMREDESMFHGSGLSHGKMHRLALAEGGGMPFLLSACTTPFRYMLQWTAAALGTRSSERGDIILVTLH